MTKQTLEKKRNTNKVWFNSECQKKVDKKREGRDLWLNNMTNESLKLQYYTLRRETQIFLRQKKRQYYNDTLAEAEDDFQHHRARQMYQNIKKATDPYKRRETLIKDKDGNIITNEERVSERWAEYFADLLNSEEPETKLECDRPDTVDMEVIPPSIE